MNKTAKKILIALLILVLLTPVGIFLPMFFDAGDAWGEWSAETVESMIGYVPQGLQHYSTTYSAPLPDYSLDAEDPSVARQSLYYILSGLIGAALTLGVTWGIAKLLVKRKAP